METIEAVMEAEDNCLKMENADGDSCILSQKSNEGIIHDECAEIANLPECEVRKSTSSRASQARTKMAQGVEAVV